MNDQLTGRNLEERERRGRIADASGARELGIRNFHALLELPIQRGPAHARG